MLSSACGGRGAARAPRHAGAASLGCCRQLSARLCRPHQPAAQQGRGSRLAAVPGLGDDELDVAVFRFTLGIPGFDDADIPRVVGAAIAGLIALNHVISGDPPPAQARAEFLDITLAALCFVAPEIEARLRSVVPGRGRAGAGQVDGSAQLFALAPQLGEAAKKELAWASFALLKNVNCCSVLLLQPSSGRALLARGAVSQHLAAPGGDAAASLQRIAQSASGASSAVLQGGQQVWLPDRGALQQAGLASWGFVPSGAQSAVVQAVPGGALLVVLAERPRALSGKDRKWVAAMADKLGGFVAA